MTSPQRLRPGLQQICGIHQASYDSYGRDRIQAELRDLGQRVNHKRIARLMREAGIQGISRRRGYCVTTRRNRRERPAPDRVKRQFVAMAPNQLWVADMTYIPTWSGFLYLAMVLDVFSRNVVGWAFGDTMSADLVLSALNMARDTSAAGGDPSFRPRQPIHQPGLWPTLPRNGYPDVHGQRRRRLRQR